MRAYSRRQDGDSDLLFGIAAQPPEIVIELLPVHAPYST
jgi:hypothetical protein